MKYVRTKQEIFKEKRRFKEIKDGKIYEYSVVPFKHHLMPIIYIPVSDIIKEADTIEKLCDEFIFNKERVVVLGIDNGYMKGFYDNWIDKITWQHIKEGIYGAIWTDKGLIYVAKMNEKGEFELV